VLRQDAVLAIPLFLRLCDTEDILLATSSVEVFLSMAVERHFADVELLLQRMLASPVPDVSVAGARQAVWAALLLDQARPLLTQASQGTPAQRLGVAQMLAPNVRFIAGQSNLTDVLGALFDDCDAKVRDAAARCFLELLGNVTLNQYEGLVERFASSIAFSDHYHMVLRVLDESVQRLSVVTSQVLEHFLYLVDKSLPMQRGRYSHDVAVVTRLLLREYSQTGDPAVRTRCLDLLDRAFAVHSPQIDELIAHFERP